MLRVGHRPTRRRLIAPGRSLIAQSGNRGRLGEALSAGAGQCRAAPSPCSLHLGELSALDGSSPPGGPGLFPGPHPPPLAALDLLGQLRPSLRAGPAGAQGEGRDGLTGPFMPQCGRPGGQTLECALVEQREADGVVQREQDGVQESVAQRGQRALPGTGGPRVADRSRGAGVPGPAAHDLATCKDAFHDPSGLANLHWPRLGSSRGAWPLLMLPFTGPHKV